MAISKWPSWEQFLQLYKSGQAFFRNDGCTVVPDLDFKICCMEHDYLYASKGVSRREADRRLRQCMQRSGWVALPWIYWLGVRLFGSRFYGKTGRESRLTFTTSETDEASA